MKPCVCEFKRLLIAILVGTMPLDVYGACRVADLRATLVLFQGV
jgi:hypothetical protein